jgi:nucleotide-binding universal stress UspA family protein
MNESENQARGRIVVGLDQHGQPAGSLVVAADEAVRRGTELAIVTVVRPNRDPGLNVFGRQRDQALAEATALQGLHAAAATLHASHPDLGVTTYCLGEGEIGPNREPLLWAELLVIGTQDRYGRQALVLGSVSWLLLTSSRCPVMVVPDGWPVIRHHRSGTSPMILVGVTEHPADAAVVRAAYAAATGREAEVVLLHAYSLRQGETGEAGRERARKVLAGYLAQAPEGARVSMAVTEEEPAAALLRLAADAILLVIGGRTGALSGLVRGSVSHAVLETVPCPVLAVPRHLAASRPGSLTGLTLTAPEPGERSRDHEPSPPQPTS